MITLSNMSPPETQTLNYTIKQPCVIIVKPVESQNARQVKSYFNAEATIEADERNYACSKKFKLIKNLPANSEERNLYVNSGELYTKEHESSVPDCSKQFNSESMAKSPFSSDTEQHECFACQKIFDSKVIFDRHLEINHNREGFKCSKMYRTKSDLNSHLLTHREDVVKPYICNVCSKAFSFESVLKRHLHSHTHKKSHQCYICQRKFDFSVYLKRHLLTHTGEKPHECAMCKNKFRLKADLNIHLLIHTGEKPHKCVVCLKRFRVKSNLKVHLLKHAKEKPHKCSICQMVFRSKELYSQHFILKDKLILICPEEKELLTEKKHSDITQEDHTKEDQNIKREKQTTSQKSKQFQKEFHNDPTLPTENLSLSSDQEESYDSKPKVLGFTRYRCNMCKKKFKQHAQLNRHYLIHSGERSYRCDLCPKTFLHKCDLNRHLLIHSQEKRHECTVCHRKFIQKAHLNRHFFIHTEERNHECSVCEKKFKHITDLNRHILYHSDYKPYECVVCQKKYCLKSQLTRHLPSHSQEKTHVCHFCYKAFNNKQSLNRHLKIHIEKIS